MQRKLSLLVDLWRAEDRCTAVDDVENRQVPFLVAVNGSAGTDRYPVDAVGDALALSPGIPLVRMDARDPTSYLATLVTLVERALRRADTWSVTASG